MSQRLWKLSQEEVTRIFLFFLETTILNLVSSAIFNYGAFLIFSVFDYRIKFTNKSFNGKKILKLKIAKTTGLYVLILVYFLL